MVETKLSLPGYIPFNNPCNVSNQSHPRGGTIFFVKQSLVKYITSINISFNDFIVLNLVNKNVICGTYIPPNDSTYMKDHFEYLDALIQYAQLHKQRMLVIGDENCRLGKLDDLNRYSYTANPDETINNNGTKLRNLIKSNKLIPINHLIKGNKTYHSDFTFHRGDHKSQIDWIIANNSAISSISNFKVCSDFPSVSDHLPVMVEFNIDLSVPLSTILDSICDITKEKNNHSVRKNFKYENVDKLLFTTLCSKYLQEIEKDQSLSNQNSMLSQKVNDILYKSAKESTKKNSMSAQGSIQHQSKEYKPMMKEINDEERRRWKQILESRDSKKLWKQINWKGDMNEDIQTEHVHTEFAEVLEKRSSCRNGEDIFDDINTNTFIPSLDGRITASEIQTAAQQMNRNSKSNTGISANFLLLVLDKLLVLLLTLFNNIFRGVNDKYPLNWLSAIRCISKKGKFDLTNFRGITLKEILAKLYDCILMNRLQKWLQIPDQQTAYQKGKGCVMHVFFVRALIAISQKAKKSLFIGVTDFTAAFDTISRRRLFSKLVRRGIGMYMLNALKDMYTNTVAYVSIQGEYSDLFTLQAGVLQGASTSTLLFMAYTSDIVSVFNTHFAQEMYIHMYHLLLHADDSLILASTKQLLIDKYYAMDNYCSANFLYLQPKKCGFICINSNETSSIALKGGTIKCMDEILYLGSRISCSGHINDDIKLEIASKLKNFNKFYAFINKNENAPMAVKMKVLESCLCSAILYNCESWGNGNVKNLEKKYTAVLKYMLGVKTRSCNEFPYVELGLIPLSAIIMKRQYRFYKKVISERDWPLLRHIVRQSRDINTGFINYYDKLIERYKNEGEIIDEAKQKMKNCITEKATAGKSRYSTYMMINPSLEKSNIYSRIDISAFYLQKVTKLRTVNHSLAIEVGRYGRNPKPKDQRLCHCNEVETEDHFLLKCPLYEHIRRKYNVIRTNTLPEVLELDNIAIYVNELHDARAIYTK